MIRIRLYVSRFLMIKLLTLVILSASSCVILERFPDPVHNAAFEGDVKKLNALISSGIDVNLPQEYDRRTPLHFAVSAGRIEAVEFLVANGADVNARNLFQNTALHAAADEGHVNIVDILLRNGAEIDAKNRCCTPLMLAAYKGHKDVADLLISKGADIDAIDNSGRSALYYSVKYKHPGITAALLDHGADVNFRDKYATPLFPAVENNDDQMVAFLLGKGADLEARTNHRDTALALASDRGYLVIVRRLVENGANIEARNEYGNTPVYLASFQGHYEVVRYLIQKGAAVNVKNNEGHTPLSTAIKEGHNNVATLLRDNGAVK